MSKISKAVSANAEERILRESRVVNFMGGVSYRMNPIDTLRMIAASSIFAEPSYYRKGGLRDCGFNPEFMPKSLKEDVLFKDYIGATTTAIFEKAIDDALSYDFKATLKLARELRVAYKMRLNPQVIMVRAAIHPDRQKFTKEYPGYFKRIEARVMSRADEPAMQTAYYLYATGGKKKMPSILKRSIAAKLRCLTPYEINKYKNAEIGMINTVRIVHATSNEINELMRTGTIEVPDEQETWEQKRSAGMSWAQIVNTTKLGHMALLRNLRNIFTEIDDIEFCKRTLETLKDGVLDGKQFPFRYENAFRMIEQANVNHKPMILDALQECVDISIDNLPRLKGKTMALSDNSGSAWGALTSEYGTTKVANIDNLSAVIAGRCSDEGYVGVFGDRLNTYPVSKRDGILTQTNIIDKDKGRLVGHNTEGGMWHFFRDAIREKIWYDNIFIFSDMQAGTGGLYGSPRDHDEYSQQGFSTDFKSREHGHCMGHIDVYKLVQRYRETVNPKVNVFCVQTAGYDNIVMPIMSYRTAMLTGWTGKEILFAAEYIKQWDDIESTQQ